MNSKTTKNWMLQPLGNIEAYISSVHQIPLLTLEEEQELVKRMHQADMDAAEKLILSHLRVVVSIARKYLGYGLPHADLIQEGNIGLMKAVRNFKAEHNVRLVSYAIYWIKSEIHSYIVKNWRMVQIASSKPHRKLFFNLRSMKQDFKNSGNDEDSHRRTMNSAEILEVSTVLNVSQEDVKEMETRFAGGDVVLDLDEEDEWKNSSWLADSKHEPTVMLAAQEREFLLSDGITIALEELDDRSRTIIQERWLNVNDNGTGGMTLLELGSMYGVSYERIRQIESAAIKKMKKTLEEFYQAESVY